MNRLEVRANAKRNMLFGIANKLILLLFPFAVKSIINSTLGMEYLGLNSLFSSILQVLLLSELGLGAALVYHMYKPIADNDQKKINALLNLYKKSYFFVGVFILTFGLVIIPFLPYLIKGNRPEDINIYIIYIIQLLNTCVSYFLFGYKQSLLAAYQREDVNSIINLTTQATLQIVQIALLLTTHNYYFFVSSMLVFTVINNLWIGFITRKIFPKARCEGTLDKNVLCSVKKLVAGTFIQKACSVTRNSLDSICISAFVGLYITGIYNNYYMIMSGVTLLLGVVSTSLAGGIGNHVATKTSEENFKELQKLDFLYMAISGWCTACLLCLFQPFMKIWMGEEMTLPFEVVILICVYFYILKMGDMRTLYSTANGLWWIMRYRSIVETLGNVLLNVFLGFIWGVYGIVCATIISIFFCNFIWSSSILFENYFGKACMKCYFSYHIKYALVYSLICFVAYYICLKIEIENNIGCIIFRLIVCSLTFALIFFVFFGKNKTFKESVSFLKKKA